MPRPTEMWNKARAITNRARCPKCGVFRGEPCIDLRTHRAREIALPHRERVLLAEAIGL